MRTDAMAKAKTGRDEKPGAPRVQPKGERSSPGSGEDEDVNGQADLQPDDVEDGDTAR